MNETASGSATTVISAESYTEAGGHPAGPVFRNDPIRAGAGTN
jgi:hypothetical protein